MDEHNEQKYALITGGSEGVGFAIAEMLARHNFHVMLVARDLEKLEAARAQLAHEKISVFSCDVTNEGALATLRNYVAVVTPHVDVLVNAAGTFRWDPSEINLDVVNADSKEFVMHIFSDMIPAGGWVVNISSQAALFAQDDPRRVDEEEYVKSMQRVDALSAEFAAKRPDAHVYVSHPPLMRGKIAETQFRGRPGFENVNFGGLPGPEIVAQEIEEMIFKS